MRFRIKNCLNCNKNLITERNEHFCSLKCKNKHDKKQKDYDIWDKMMEKDAKLKKIAEKNERLRRKGIF